MHRIDTDSAEADTNGVGKDGFTQGNPTTGVPATVVSADWLNEMQEEVANVVEGSGGALQKGEANQLLAAILSLAGSGIAASNYTETDLSAYTTTPLYAGTGYSVLTSGQYVEHIVMAGASGKIVHSDDGGASWSSMTAAASFSSDFYGACPIDDGAILVGTSGEIQRLSAGTWSQISTVGGDLYSVASNGATVVAVGNSGLIRYSTDSGQNFSTATGAGTTLLRSVVYGNGIFMAVGDQTVFTSADGISWSSASITDQTDVTVALAYCPVRTRWYVNSDTNVRFSDDNGASWALGGVMNAAGSPANDAGLFVVDTLTGVVLGADSTYANFSLSTDGGVTWRSIRTPQSYLATAAFFADGAFLITGSDSSNTSVAISLRR